MKVFTLTQVGELMNWTRTEEQSSRVLFKASTAAVKMLPSYVSSFRNSLGGNDLRYRLGAKCTKWKGVRGLPSSRLGYPANKPNISTMMYLVSS